MIPVEAKPEPDDFDTKVRQKGLEHLAEQGLALDQPLPPKAKITAYWRNCMDQLYAGYDGTCAYLAVFFEKVTGAGAVEHFVPKSSLAGQAYEWGNYRLATHKMNSRKGLFDDVLDPFEIGEGWFRLELVSGHIYANPSVPERTAVQATIDRLKLDDGECKAMRKAWFDEYLAGHISADFLKRKSPFVWFEANRQGLL
jgi:hypothetical protein